MQADVANYNFTPLLEASLAQLRNELLMSGAPAVDPADFSFKQFAAASDSQKKTILQNISLYLQILAQEIEPSTSNVDSRFHEVARLKSALHTFGLKALSNGIFEKIDVDDVIEVYNDQAIQLYRNIRFFKLCSYNLLDLGLNSWDSLYEKPGTILSELLKIQELVMTSAEGVVAYDVGTFIQREKFKYAQTLRTFKVSPKFICPVVDMQTGRRAGFISTYSADVLTEGVDSLKFSIL